MNYILKNKSNQASERFFHENLKKTLKKIK